MFIIIVPPELTFLQSLNILQIIVSQPSKAYEALFYNSIKTVKIKYERTLNVYVVLCVLWFT